MKPTRRFAAPKVSEVVNFDASFFNSIVDMIDDITSLAFKRDERFEHDVEHTSARAEVVRFKLAAPVQYARFAKSEPRLVKKLGDKKRKFHRESIRYA